MNFEPSAELLEVGLVAVDEQLGDGRLTGDAKKPRAAERKNLQTATGTA